MSSERKVLKQAKSCSNEWEERCSETLEDALMDSPRIASVEEMNKGCIGDARNEIAALLFRLPSVALRTMTGH